MKIDAIREMWQEDCRIGIDLSKASIDTPVLHSKYLSIYTQEKGVLTAYELEQKKLLKQKWLYYNGKMDKEQIEALGWEFDPFDGLKVMKGEMNYYYDADDDIQKSEAKIQLQKQKLDMLKDILDNIKWRHQTIRNIIEWKKFEAGA